MIQNNKRTRKGFTLLEILLVIAAIGILASIVLVAINPNRQLAQARNAERRSDINTLYKALEQYLIDNQSYPAGIDETPRDICGTTTGCVNLGEGVLVPTYIAAIPVDPQGGAYRVSRNSDNNRISVTAPGAELSQTIAINPPPPKFVATSCTYTDKKISIPYTAGEVGYNYASQTINSTGVTGLTATLTSGTLSASGTLEYEVTGTPSGVGTANFDFSNIGNTGVGCNNSNIAVNVIEVLDSNYNNVALLINGNGTNGSTSIIDSSSNSNTVTAFGNSQISNVQSKFGGSSLAFDGSGDYLSAGDFADHNLSGVPFTVEAWIYPTSYASGANFNEGRTVVGKWNDTGIHVGWRLEITTSSITWYTNTTTKHSTAISLNQWTHIAVCGDGTTSSMYKNGVKVSGPSSDVFSNTVNKPLIVGALLFGSYEYYFDGYIDDLRITKGVARYTSNFTPPTAELPTSGNILTY